MKNRFYRQYCGLCSHLLNPNAKHRTLIFNSKPIKVCMNCTSKDHKVIENKHNDCDIGCSMCYKKTMNKNCILCKLCNHFVHGSCLNLKISDIRTLDQQGSDWYCLPCIQNILPFYATSISDDENAIDVSTRANSVKQCHTCQTNLPHKKVLYNNRKALYNGIIIEFCISCSVDSYKGLQEYNTLLEFIDCSICTKIVKYESVFCSFCLHSQRAQNVAVTL